MTANPATASGAAVIESAVRQRLPGRGAPLLVALDGGSGAGKSTVAGALAELFSATVVDGDDFYAGGTSVEWDARTPAANADHCIDWHRLRAEALEPLLGGVSATWHPYDWNGPGGLLATTRTCQPSSVVILDGAYSSRPELADLLGLAILVDAPAGERHRRVVGRDSPMDDSWFARWDAAERYYFTYIRPASAFDLVVSSASAAQPSPAADGSQRQQHEHEPRNRQDR